MSYESERIITVYLTEDEYKWLHETAKQHKCTLSAYVRYRVFGYPDVLEASYMHRSLPNNAKKEQES